MKTAIKPIISPLYKTNKYFIHPFKIVSTPKKHLVISGDNDLDFTFSLLKAYPKVSVACSTMDSVYRSFWTILKRVGAREYNSFFSSNIEYLTSLSYTEVFKIANTGTSMGACATFFLIQCSLDGTPFVPGTSISKYLLFDSMRKITNIQKYLDRIEFVDSFPTDIFLCLDEFERDFATRNTHILSANLEDTVNKKNCTIVSNISFPQSKPIHDDLGNIIYKKVVTND